MMIRRFRFKPPFTNSIHRIGRTFANEMLSVEDHENVTAAEISKFLDENNISHSLGNACIATTCPKYSRTKMKLNQVDQLYINATTGFFVCRSCKKFGVWSKLKDNISALMAMHPELISKVDCFENWKVDDYSKNSTEIKTLLDKCVNVDLSERAHDSLITNLGWEGIKQETLSSFGVSVLPEMNGVVLPSYDVEMIPQWIKIIKLKNKKQIISTLPNLHDFVDKSFRLIYQASNRLNHTGLFGWHLAKDKKRVIITSSEVDAMVVNQQIGYTAVSLPKSTSSLPQESLPFLESFTKIIIWFENDMLAFGNAKSFANKLGVKRTLLVRPEVGNPSPLKALQSDLNLNAIVSSSTPLQHTHIVSFADHRQEVKNELQFAKEVAGVRWIKYNRLNEILKGHRRGELTVFTGGTGSGKTTFISDYSLDLCLSGVNTLWGSFEINNVRLIKMMLQQFAKKNLAKNIDEFEKYADQFEQLSMYFMNFHGQESVKKVIETMSHAVYVYDIRHVIVDNLQFMMGAMETQTDRFSKQDIIVGSFRKFATTMNCHVTLVIHPRKESNEELTTNSIFGGAKASQEADNILILQRVGTALQTRKYLQVTKNRFDGQLGSLPLRFDKESLTFISKPVKRKNNVTNEIEEENPQHNTTEGNEQTTW